MKKLTIKGALPTLNEYIRLERGNRYAGAKVKKEATELVQWQAQGFKPISGKVDIVFTWHTTKKADHDNIAFAKKFILDGLVKAGVLKNDNPKYIGDFKDRFVKADEDSCVLEFRRWER